MTAPLLALKGLGVSVRSATGRLTTILHRTSLEVGKSEIVAIIGPSGGGKSTLLKAILGIIPFTQGSMAFKNATIRRPLDATHRSLRKASEAVFQNPIAALNPYATLRATLSEPLLSMGVAPADRDTLVEMTAKRMGLRPGVLDRRPAAVSLGEAQRACIARALAPKPALLLLDEPLSALDALVAADVANLLTEVIGETRPTVLFVSHDMRLVRRLATRLIVVEAGRIVEDGPASRLLDAPQSAAARELIDSDRRRRARFVVEGHAPRRDPKTRAIV
ncbi:MAG: ATP-binding cassette domain-containing protein [Pseudomonadota bacterium]